MDPALPLADVLLRLATAALLGGLIGLERERLERAAGLRTHAVVAVASALMMIVSAFGFADAVAPNRTAVLDPSRLAAQVVSGIGFLGAGVIIFQKNRVRGLTTAASIWAVAGVGLAAGGGLYTAAAAGTLFVLLIQAGLRPIERRLFLHAEQHRLVLEATRRTDRLALIAQAVTAAAVDVHRVRVRSVNGDHDRIDLDLGAARPEAVAAFLSQVRALDGVRVVGYSRGPGRPARTDDNGFAHLAIPQPEDRARPRRGRRPRLRRHSASDNTGSNGRRRR
jgi:putative Mg2+ transporter-C (MgtC) family protein